MTAYCSKVLPYNMENRYNWIFLWFSLHWTACQMPWKVLSWFLPVTIHFQCAKNVSEYLHFFPIKFYKQYCGCGRLALSNEFMAEIIVQKPQDDENNDGIFVRKLFIVPSQEVEEELRNITNCKKKNSYQFLYSMLFNSILVNKVLKIDIHTQKFQAGWSWSYLNTFLYKTTRALNYNIRWAAHLHGDVFFFFLKKIHHAGIMLK